MSSPSRFPRVDDQRMLSVPPHPDWSRFEGPAPIAPRLLLTPQHAAKPVRCYDARVHKSGLRVTIGVFDTPDGEESVVFVMERLMLDPSEVPSAGTQMIRAGRLEGMARTGWIRLAQGDDGSPAHSSWPSTIANINWYFPEQTTTRVHFVSTFIDPSQGQAASNLVHELLHSAVFVEDSGGEVQTSPF